MKKFTLTEVAKGYAEMGEINLALAEEFFLLEEEGVKGIYEMGTEKAEGQDS